MESSSTNGPTVDQLWNALRDVACSTGRKAQRIVLVHRSDVERALALLMASAPAAAAKTPVSPQPPNDQFSTPLPVLPISSA